ncbi:Flagellar hook-associated protein 2 [bioreactor metagenome]|uniref:Filament cap protein n=1 Tax=bioreactor metagenome TaxID=1076179 RepID=A0A644W317_9ZZZZ
MVTRTYGLSGSGMDVDQMVKDLMKAQRVRYDTMVQKKTQVEWKKADFNTMYNSISDFRNTVFNYKLQSTLQPKQVTSSNEAVASITANTDAANISHDLTVHQLATGAKKASSAAITADGKTKDTLANQFGVTGTFDIVLNDGTASKTISVDSSKSIYELVANINNSGLNIKASYDTTLDRFFLSTTKTGETAKIDLSANTGTGQTFLENSLKLGAVANVGSGQDAIFSLDGIGSTTDVAAATNLKMDSNSFTISGVTYNLKSTGSTNATVLSDNDKAIASVKAFVEAYNTALSKVNGELKETKYSDFLPLTADQRSDMSESEIKTWEEKAKSGTLRNNSILQSMVNSMRSSISTPISGLTGKYNTMSSIGITTGSYTENGKLYLNETKLKEALEADPDILTKMFTTDGENSSKDGIATRLYDTLKVSMDKISTEAGITASIDTDTKSALAKKIIEYNKSIEAFNDRMADLEERYYTQFNAMETALSKLSQQSSWLTQQFSIGS